MDKIINVTFKEGYMPDPVSRPCVNMSRQQIIDWYGLDKADIEWYQFEGEERITNKRECCLCGAPILGLGNNADPLAQGRCCDTCNAEKVIPARMTVIMKELGINPKK